MWKGHSCTVDPTENQHCSTMQLFGPISRTKYTVSSLHGTNNEGLLISPSFIKHISCKEPFIIIPHFVSVSFLPVPVSSIHPYSFSPLSMCLYFYLSLSFCLWSSFYLPIVASLFFLVGRIQSRLSHSALASSIIGYPNKEKGKNTICIPDHVCDARGKKGERWGNKRWVGRQRVEEGAVKVTVWKLVKHKVGCLGGHPLADLFLPKEGSLTLSEHAIHFIS